MDHQAEQGIQADFLRRLQEGKQIRGIDGEDGPAVPVGKIGTDPGKNQHGESLLVDVVGILCVSGPRPRRGMPRRPRAGRMVPQIPSMYRTVWGYRKRTSENWAM